jgi:hypothetical protein
VAVFHLAAISSAPFGVEKDATLISAQKRCFADTSVASETAR